VTPSRVLSIPETAPSGTGLAGMETSVMGGGVKNRSERDHAL
jgi:hypothetical protein